jgi:hypothetical protein
MWLVLPAVMVGRVFGGSRRIWSMVAERTDLPDEQDLIEEWEEVVHGERDRRLLAALYDVHEKRSGESLEVAVVYGAGHVAAIVHGMLERYGYRPRSADRVNVVDL